MMMMPHTICVFYLYLKKWQLWSYEVRRSLFPSPSLFSFSLTIPILSKNFPPFPSLVFFPHPLSSFSLFSANQTFSLSAIFFQSGWSTIREAAKCLKTFANRLPPPKWHLFLFSILKNTLKRLKRDFCLSIGLCLLLQFIKDGATQVENRRRAIFILKRRFEGGGREGVASRVSWYEESGRRYLISRSKTTPTSPNTEVTMELMKREEGAIGNVP